jgi:DNA-binding MarR family transcriptional regulator
MALPVNTAPEQAGHPAFARLPQLAAFRFCLRQFLSFSEASCEQSGLTTQQYQLLQLLGAAEQVDNPKLVTITQVAERLLLRHNSAVELVDRAERAQLVRRTEDQKDHRRAIVEMTPHGRNLLAHLTVEHLTYLEGTAPNLIQSLNAVLPQPHTSQ